MEIIIDYNKFHDYICGFVDPYEIPAVENAVNKAMKRDLVRCGECNHSQHWYSDKCRCFLWSEVGIDVFEDGFCNYGERRADDET